MQDESKIEAARKAAEEAARRVALAASKANSQKTGDDAKKDVGPKIIGIKLSEKFGNNSTQRAEAEVAVRQSAEAAIRKNSVETAYKIADESSKVVTHELIEAMSTETEPARKAILEGNLVKSAIEATRKAVEEVAKQIADDTAKKVEQESRKGDDVLANTQKKAIADAETIMEDEIAQATRDAAAKARTDVEKIKIQAEEEVRLSKEDK